MIYTDIHGRGEPALPNWESPRLDEPAHGYLVRLASLNHQNSARVLAETFGLNGRFIQPKECLEFALSLPAEHKERLIRATPVVTTKTVELMGEVFRRRDWLVERRFFCPACLAEDGYHRCYWDLAAFRRCPFHELPLVCEDTAGRPMPWWCPSFSHSPHGNEIVRRGIATRTQPLPSIETYILGRMGLVKRLDVPVLDNLKNMGDRISATYFVGRVVLSGLHPYSPAFNKRNASSYTAALQAGFSVMLNGQAAVQLTFEKLFDAAVPLTNRRTQSMKILFGWSYACADRHVGEFGKQCVQVMLGIAAERGELSVNRPCTVSLDKVVHWTTISDIAAGFGITKERVRRIAEKLDLIDPKTVGRRLVVFDRDDAARIRNTIATFVNRDGAAAILGISRSFFDALVRATLIVRFIRMRGPGCNSDRFRPEEILAFAAKIVDRATMLDTVPLAGRRLGQLRRTTRNNPAQLVRAILDGKGTILGRTSDRFCDVVIQGPDGTDRVARAREVLKAMPGVARMDAAAIFGDRYEVIVALVKAKKLKTVSPTSRRIDPEDLAEFCRRYAPMRIYRSALDCDTNQVGRRLVSRGVKTIHVKTWSGQTRIVDRESARRLLQLECDPDVISKNEPSAFAAMLAEQVRRTTTFKLEGKKDGLSFRNGRGTLRLKVSIDPSFGSVRIGPRYHMNRNNLGLFERLRRRKPEIIANYPSTLTWIDDGKVLCIEEHLDAPELANPTKWRALGERLMASMQSFRLLLEPAQRRGNRMKGSQPPAHSGAIPFG